MLDIPDTVKVVAMTPLGYPASPELIGPVEESRRKPAGEIFSTDHYDGPSGKAEYASR